MGPERSPAEPEHPVADREGGDPAADRLHLAGELGPEDRHPRPPQPDEEPVEERLGRPHPAVGPVHRDRMDPDQHVVVLDGRLLHLNDPDDLRRTVPIANRCPHG
jgi:hypothetical protein